MLILLKNLIVGKVLKFGLSYIFIFIISIIINIMAANIGIEFFGPELVTKEGCLLFTYVPFP